MSETILEMRDITKAFSGVNALADVSLKVDRDEIHALVGENGAGKSTLMKILGGVYPHDSYVGTIHYEGARCWFKNVKDSERLGIVIIHQELALIPYLSIAENIFLGNERAKAGIIDWRATTQAAGELLAKVGLRDHPNTRVADIGVGKQQLVEIAKALAKKVKLLILDEPTAALNDEESNKLLALLLDLKKQGVTSILISHKLDEIAKVSDSITVLRDGKVIETLDNAARKIDQHRIIKSMVGREIVDRFPKRESKIGEVVFEVKNWNVYDPLMRDHKVINDVSFNVRRGEVVGLAGLMGAGRTELAMSLFGRSYGKRHSGHIYKNGVEIRLDSVSESIKHGIAYLTEDRKNYGLVLINDVKWNISLASLGKVSRGQVINQALENKAATDMQQSIRIRCTGIDQIVESLSGGNQQKVVLAKWIMAEPEILLLDEPTRGIDVGAKYEIYSIINRLVGEGKSVVMISSELPELLGMCDRIYVVTDGEISGELARDDATPESIMSCIMNHKREART